MTATILTGDCRDVLATMDAASVEAVVTDPPYGYNFMGRDWDKGVPGLRFWEEIGRVMKPGAHLLAFGGTRTFHRLAVAIEDAGFEMRDAIGNLMLLGWVYGSGFPKSRNLDGEWAGWGTALKPAWEPIIVARKPLAERTVAANVLEYGTGALNIAATRIAHRSAADRAESEGKNQHTRYANPGSNRDSYSGDMPPRTDYDRSAGRWPANVVLDEAAAAALDAQSGERKAGNHPAQRRGIGFTENGGYANGGTNGERRATDTGGASRFFYCAKASRAERNRGLDGMPERKQGQRYRNIQDGRPHTRDGYEYPRKPMQNHHPTVKPVALMQWLVRLVTPPGGTVLDPFLGSGSTLIAAQREGFDGIGIELNPEYVEIARRRIAADTLPLWQTERAS